MPQFQRKRKTPHPRNPVCRSAMLPWLLMCHLPVLVEHEELSRSPDETGNVKETALSVRTISGAAAPVQIGSTTTSTSPPTHQHSPLSPPSHSSHPIPSEHHAPVSKETKETKEDEESEEDEWVLPAKKVKGLSSSVQSSVGKKKKRSDEIWTSEK
ncbi:hypothetical protein BV25DRAFT_948406 [Artomyces pyxidatus]|uniref:Uncharacterized protein n=1 Tax=Artomyces pyxidatus TaxID=48021 RepID=A0ACB8SXF2_9AGAM|nr:hypothetical protein BV25DRAFT_948406 [Artomyces pyxidatus]